MEKKDKEHKQYPLNYFDNDDEKEDTSPRFVRADGEDPDIKAQSTGEHDEYKEDLGAVPSSSVTPEKMKERRSKKGALGQTVF